MNPCIGSKYTGITRHRKKIVAGFFVGLLTLSGGLLGRNAFSEEVPFFKGDLSAFPNVMIIFDNSNSMANDVNGNSVSDGWVKVDLDGYPDESGTNTLFKGGGNHPNSKLYQAKVALNKILRGSEEFPSEPVDLRNGLENVNLGFATYAQKRNERSRGKYEYQDPADPARYLRIYRYPYNAKDWDGPSNKFYYGGWHNYTGIGQTFTRHFNTFSGEPFDVTLEYRVVHREECFLHPGQGKYNYYFTYYLAKKNQPSYGACFKNLWNSSSTCSDTNSRFHGSQSDPLEVGDTFTYHHNPRYSIQVAVPGSERDLTIKLVKKIQDTENPTKWHYLFQVMETYEPGYWDEIDTENNLLWYARWRYQWESIDCDCTTAPENCVVCDVDAGIPGCENETYFPQYWSNHGIRVDPCVQRDRNLGGCPTCANLSTSSYYFNCMRYNPVPGKTRYSWRNTNAPDCDDTKTISGQTATLVPGTCYENDYFTYPADGSTNRPHTWSYYATDGNTWPDDIQPSPYYSDTLTTDPDDPPDNSDYGHVVFVNLPTGNDEGMTKKAEILPYINIADTETTPEYPDRSYTTMPQNPYSIAPSNYNNYGTPLAASLEKARDYFLSYISQDEMSLLGCRKNFVILLTDGMESAGGSPTQAAADLYNIGESLDPPKPDIHVTTFVVAFGVGLDQVGGEYDYTLDDVASLGSGGNYPNAFYAENLDELVAQLVTIFTEITQGSYSRSEPIISATEDGGRIYTAYFRYPGWDGHMAAYNVDLGTGEISFDPNWPSQGDFKSDAGVAIKNQASRTLYTTTSTGLIGADPIAFAGGNASQLFGPLSISEDIDGDSDIDTDDAVDIIGFTPDPNYDSPLHDPGYYKGTRNADWMLQDIYHSTPVLVGAPKAGITKNQYATFKANYGDRPRILYVSANDGMVHAIRDDNGEELWGFIPYAALSGLQNLRNEHTFLIDAKPTIADIYSEGGSGTAFTEASQTWEGWRTVLVSGMRQGGKAYFALEITNPGTYSSPNAPRVLWEFTDTYLGETWSTPAIGQVKWNNGSEVVDKWVVIVGGGYTGTAGNYKVPASDNVGNSVYIIDIETGDVLTEGSNTSRYTGLGSASNKIVAGIKEVDIDEDGYIERAYFGDLEGKLWRIDLSDPDMSTWTPTMILDPENYNPSAPEKDIDEFDECDDGGEPGGICKRTDCSVSVGTCSYTPSAASPNTLVNRPIWYKPAVARGDSGRYLIYFGTGDELVDPKSLTTRDFFYEVEDMEGEGGLEARINWFYALPLGQKVMARPSLFNYTVYFTTFLPPTEGAQCDAGSGYLYGLTMSTGSGSSGGGEPGIWVDNEGNPVAGPEEGGAEKVAALQLSGGGVPSAPVVTNGMIYVITSNNVGASDSIQQIPTETLTLAIRGWREVF